MPISEEGKLIVAVGSRNPVKIEAVRVVLERAIQENLLPDFTKFEVTGLEVESGVSVQPVGDEETLQGASNRAAKVLQATENGHWGVGLEGGILKLEENIFTNAWCAIVDRYGNRSVGGGLLMPLPPAIVRDLEAGFELGDATDRLFGVKHSKQAGGALGYLSKNLSTRQHAYEEIFTYALVKFLAPALYELRIS